MNASELHDELAEQSIIGTAMIKPDVVDWIEIHEGQFFNLKHRHIWAAIQRLADTGVGIDLLVVGDELAKSQHLEMVGGLSYLSACAVNTVTTVNVEAYAAIVRDFAVRRDIAVAAASVIESLHEPSDVLLDLAQRRFDRISPSAKQRGGTIGSHVEEYARKMWEAYEAKCAGDQKEYYPGLPMGFHKLDGLLGGIPLAIPTIIAARPSMGKTTVALHLADYVSSNGFGGVHVFSYEDREETFAEREIAAESGVPTERIRTLDFDRTDLRAITAAVETLRGRRWWLDIVPNLPVRGLIREYRRRKRELGTRMIIVDFIQLMPWPDGAQTANAAIAYNLRALNQLAADDGIALIVMSQLNRKLEHRDDKRPTMPDLRDSGALEEYGKLIIGLYHDHHYNSSADPSVLELIVLKNHQGRKNVAVEIGWEQTTGRLGNL